jgi:hypothetical protein
LAFESIVHIHMAVVCALGFFVLDPDLFTHGDG